MDFVVPANHKVKIKENHNSENYLDLTRELRKLQNIKFTELPIVIGTLGTILRGLVRGLKWVGNRRTSRTYPNYCIVEVNQNTDKSPRDLRTLAVTQTPVKDYQLTLEWKIRTEKYYFFV